MDHTAVLIRPAGDEHLYFAYTYREDLWTQFEE